ncbi:DUF2585 family protein [Phytohalomonas tamaricis]|uniref:DUF2585 family protein n=1 Tax=Phytohalomonas tamaricis TaxID=2081032 RepID=UPI000D0B5BCE|nr:DUF2585 family protein [Phytohalomonas tamaricis]
MADNFFSMWQRTRHAVLKPWWGHVLRVVLVLGTMVVWLKLVGRSYICPCGVVVFWQSELDPAQNSQQFADWYSLLHVMYGFGLFIFANVMRPHWSLGAKALMALVSSAIWEMVENTPFVVALFKHSPHAPTYWGDSILNSLGDTLFVMIGFGLATRLSLWAIAALAVALELAVSFAINDGMVLATLRLFGIPVSL